DPYTERLIFTADMLCASREFNIAIVVAHMACEIATEQALSRAYAARSLAYLEDPVGEFLNGHNLANPRIRNLYNALLGDRIEEPSFWQPFVESSQRRNRAVHST